MVDLRGQTKPLKGHYQIVAPQDCLQVDGVGRETPAGDFAQGVGILEFAQQELLKTSVAVEAPNRGRSQIQVGDQRA